MDEGGRKHFRFQDLRFERVGAESASDESSGRPKGGTPYEDMDA
jgi:hypothetical protein